MVSSHPSRTPIQNYLDWSNLQTEIYQNIFDRIDVKGPAPRRIMLVCKRFNKIFKTDPRIAVAQALYLSHHNPLPTVTFEHTHNPNEHIFSKNDLDDLNKIQKRIFPAEFYGGHTDKRAFTQLLICLEANISDVSLRIVDALRATWSFNYDEVFKNARSSAIKNKAKAYVLAEELLKLPASSWKEEQVNLIQWKVIYNPWDLYPAIWPNNLEKDIEQSLPLINQQIFENDEFLLIILRLCYTPKVPSWQASLCANKSVEFWTKLVEKTGSFLGIAPDSIKDNEQVVKAALKNDWDVFRFASPRLRDNHEVALLALHGQHLRMVSERLLNDETFVLEAFRRSWGSFLWLGGGFRNNYRVMIEVMKINYFVHRMFPFPCPPGDELKNNPQFQQEAKQYILRRSKK